MSVRASLLALMGLGTGPRYSASSERQGLVSPVQNSRTQSISSSLVSEASDPGQCPKDGEDWIEGMVLWFL